MRTWLSCLLIGIFVVASAAAGAHAQDATPAAPAAEAAPVEAAAAPADPASPAPDAAAAPAADAPPTPVTAESVNAKVDEMRGHIDLLWTCIAAFLVFFMQAGFALVESGLTRAKNACNIMMKNFMDFSIGSIVFWLIGFGLMFGLNPYGFIGLSDFVIDPSNLPADYFKSPNAIYAFLIFQTVFAATTATIISGAMAERTKFSSYLIYTALITSVVYPISGSWAWGNLYHIDNVCFLTAKGFVDFAGSSVVHMCGGAAALAGAITVGARKGKFNADGTANAIPGHNLPMATLGVFILWLGWFGFNAGSTTALGTGDFAQIAVVTNISACAGALFAMITSWVLFKKPDLTMTLNGALGGLVGITAGCATMTMPGALMVGALAGILVVLSVIFFDKIKVDDPVGAISVHFVCGAFGTICCAVPLFCAAGKAAPFVAQITGVGAIAAYSFVATLILFNIIKYTVGLRVSEKEEFEGLDLPEHGNEAYHGFVFMGGQGR